MLVAFVLFGALLSSMTGLITMGATLLFAVLVIAVARRLVMALVLRRVTAEPTRASHHRGFGPRGLISLLLALLVVEDGVLGSEQLLAITGAVVILSVIAHGTSAAPLGKWYGQQVARQTLIQEREGSVAGLFGEHDGQVPRIKPDELAVRMEDPNLSDHPGCPVAIAVHGRWRANPGQYPVPAE